MSIYISFGSGSSGAIVETQPRLHPHKTLPEDDEEEIWEPRPHQQDLVKYFGSPMRELLESGNYSDFTIKCGDIRHKVHKAIICPVSPFFRAALAGTTKEGQDSEVDLSEHDPAAVALMIVFFYQRDYPSLRIDGSFDSCYSPRFYDVNPQNLLHHFSVYDLAEFCQVDDLKSLALDKLDETIERYDLQDSHEFFQVAQLLYTTPGPAYQPMRDIVVKVIKNNDHLLGRPEFLKLAKTTDLAFDVLMEMCKTKPAV
ncbi:hypothetical protein F5X68DRAFT_231969 [Plectosphaerella plurivora]|uniref:BTB domain-containing protein n=1 Tax=Plectosphaerella plurivora TaxID=936078 RepID=A0A9P8V996_9PEZI|nr:hypothetical protein F5X68DRAFT_231969 [Plectosphaerella plurivora]